MYLSRYRNKIRGKCIKKKWAKGLNRLFTEEDIWMVIKYMKRCSTSLAVKEIQIKTKMRYLLIPPRIAIVKKTDSIKG